MPLPKYLKKYFWDVEFNKIDGYKNKPFIIKRILEMGDEQAVSWALDNYQTKNFKDVLKNTRDLSPRSANYWALYFNLPKSQIKCLQKPYLQQRKAVWPY